MFIREGAVVVLCDVDKAALGRLAEELGDKTIAYPFDVRFELLNSRLTNQDIARDEIPGPSVLRLIPVAKPAGQ
jgi:hypothetical protein